jgi:hypothetical protein
MILSFIKSYVEKVHNILNLQRNKKMIQTKIKNIGFHNLKNACAFLNPQYQTYN